MTCEKEENKMKKLSIILLIALVLLSVVSCKKDKSEEMIATYEEFVTVNEICDYVNRLASSETKIGDTITSVYVEKIVNAAYGSDITVKSATFTSGEYKTETSGNPRAYTNTYTVFVVSYKYTEGSDTTEKDGELTVDGTMVTSYPETRATSESTEENNVLTINKNKTYKMSYYWDYEAGYKSASVNGKDVEVRLLNADRT